MRILHISDIHIRNYKFHNEYKMIFEELYAKANELNPDIIILTGDTCHMKLTTSPSYFDITTDFFRSLADIAPLHIILGNHDLNLKNLTKLDAITPIVNALNNTNIFFHKFSKQYKLNDQFVLNILSITDHDNWPTVLDKSKINIALYHGSVSGFETDSGWVVEDGDIDIQILKSFDFCLLGDIHKANQILDKEGRIRYAGSLIQQNHGESDDKGFLLWDIESKEKFSVVHYKLENPKPFYTIVLSKEGNIPKVKDIKQGSRLRLKASSRLPLNTIRKAISEARSKFKPESITYLNYTGKEDGKINEEDLKIDLNLRDVAVQERLIKEYLEEYNVSESQLKRIYELNSTYNKLVESEEEVLRNIKWKLQKLSWDNLFNYGTGNSIDFTKLKGIVGIFGKNFSGKSSIVDTLFYSIFNSTSKNNRKNYNIINQHCTNASASVDLLVNGEVYHINRRSEKYQKKLKGEISDEAKTDVDFEKRKDNNVYKLNGESRQDTDRNIRKIFGKFEDFLLTSAVGQLEPLSYLNEGSTRRKEILAKFLDLEIFEKKFRLAKEDIVGIKSYLSKNKTREFVDEINSIKHSAKKNRFLLAAKEKEEQNCIALLTKLILDQEDIKNKINSLPSELIDFNSLCDRKNILKSKLQMAREENQKIGDKIESEIKRLEEIKYNIKNIDLDSLASDYQSFMDSKRDLQDLELELKEFELDLKRNSTKVKLLCDIPCDDKYPTCKFIKDAYKAKQSLTSIEENIRLIKVKIFTLTKELENNDIITRNASYEKLKKEEIEVSNNVSSMRLVEQTNKTLIVQLTSEFEKLVMKLADLEKHQETIENIENLILRQDEIDSEIKSVTSEKNRMHELVLGLYKENGIFEEKLRKLEEEYSEFQKTEEDYSAYDLFLRCMHSNGIAYEIIKKKLPFINEEISRILTNIVDFEVFFESDSKKLNISIRHPKHEARPIEMGSGAEKMIAAMATRLALLNVSTLPAGNIMILDEPAVSLDEDNLDGFVRMLEIIKGQFDVILLITHLEQLKDVADCTIDISKNNGFAYVNN